MREFARSMLAAFVVVNAVGCDTPQQPAPVFDIDPIQIDSVDVAVLESFPAQANAHIVGIIGDGCSELLPIEQTRDGNDIRVTIRRQRPVDAICTQIAKLYDDTVRLEGTFLPGDYRLHVNDVSVDFRVD